MKRNKLTVQVISYVMVSIVIVAMTSILSLSFFRSRTNRLVTDINENQGLAVVYREAGELKEILEEYLETGSESSCISYVEEKEAFGSALQEELPAEDAGDDDAEHRVQRGNLVGLFNTFLDQADEVFYAKRSGDVSAYVLGYERLLDVYKEIDLYIQEITSNQLMEKADEYQQTQSRLQRNYIMSVAVIIVVSLAVLILVALYSMEMTKPVTRLEQYVKRMEKQDFDFTIEEETSSEEMKTLYHAFAGMKDSIEDFLRVSQEKQELEEQLHRRNMENLQMKALLTEAELNELQAQINPHFLFNTLNIGAQMAQLHEEDEIADYLYNVADLYRYNIEGLDQKATLEEELNYVLNYVKLMQVRFGKRYRFVYHNSVEKKLLKMPVPRMILQPLVENAYTHGLRTRSEGGILELLVERDDDVLRVSVRDNGAGLSKEQIQGMLRSDEEQESRHEKKESGIGVKNVVARLRLWLKKEDVMQIVREDGVTEFTLLFPIDTRKKWEETDDADTIGG